MIAKGMAHPLRAVVSPRFWTLLITLPILACRSAELSRHEFQQAQMGLPFRIVLYAPDQATATRASDAAFARIAQLNSILSDYEEESELSKLSQSSGGNESIPLSHDMWQVLSQAQSLAKRTDGAFDITVGPLVQLWRRARRQREMPEASRRAEALTRSGYQHLVLDEGTHSALLRVKGMRLDAGAIAKGYAADEALKVLRQEGITRALVAGGGDMALGDAPPDQPGWRVEIAPPSRSGAPAPSYAVLTNAGLATSGDVFQFVIINGRRYSHIVDPRTGLALTNSSLVTIIATNCTAADSLATAVSVLGPTNGLRLIEATPGTEAHIVLPVGQSVGVYESSGWRKVSKMQPGDPARP